jgi:hypothetical protein
VQRIPAFHRRDLARERGSLKELAVSTPPKVETAARIMMPLTPATTAKKATRQIRTIRPVTSFVRHPAPGF